jgi:hypothetical protein
LQETAKSYRLKISLLEERQASDGEGRLSGIGSSIGRGTFQAGVGGADHSEKKDKIVAADQQADT